MPTSNDTPGSDIAGQLIASYLSQIGIEVKAQPVSAGKMYDLQQSGDFDAYIWYWTGDPDPNYQLSVFTSEQCGDLSDGCWRDPTYDDLVARQASTLDRDERLTLVREAQQYVYDQVPSIVLAYPNSLTAYRTDIVADLTPVPAGDGYLTPSYSYTGMVSARPAQSADPAASASGQPASGESGSDSADTAGETSSASPSGPPVWLWGIAALIVLGVVAVLVMRRRGTEDQPDTH